jgi:ribosomal protein S9
MQCPQIHSLSDAAMCVPHEAQTLGKRRSASARATVRSIWVRTWNRMAEAYAVAPEMSREHLLYTVHAAYGGDSDRPDYSFFV